MDGEEIARIVELLDQRQLLLEHRPDLGRNDVRIAFARARPGQFGEMLLRREMGGHRLVGIFVMKLRQREGEALGDLDGALDRMLLAAKQLQHLLDRLEMTLAIDLEPEARFRDGAFFADAGQDILQHAPVGMVIEHVIGGDERCPCLRAASASALSRARSPALRSMLAAR